MEPRINYWHHASAVEKFALNIRQNSNWCKHAISDFNYQKKMTFMTCDALQPISDRPSSDGRELPVWLGKSLHEIKISRVTCDQFTTVANEIRGHRVNYDQPANKGGLGASGSLASEIVKFHDRIVTVKSGHGACRFPWRVGPKFYYNQD